MKRQFFRSKFIMFTSLILTPLCIFGLISVLSINLYMDREAKQKSNSVTELMQQTISELTTSLENYKVIINSNGRFHLALIQALNSNHMNTDILQKMEQAMQAMYYSQSTKPYIHSLYITIDDSPYYIDGMSRVTFEGSLDSDWPKAMEDCSDSTYLQVRNIKLYKFDTKETPVVTAYFRMKYNELVAINILQGYFNHWLDSAANYEGQILMILNQEGEPLFFNENGSTVSEEERLNALAYGEGKASSNAFLRKYYIHSGTFPGTYGLKYLSMIPKQEIFAISYTFMRMTIAAAIVSILISLVLAYYFTRRDYRQVFQIIEIFDKAEKGEFESLPQPKAVPGSPYFHIINNVANLFVSQTYLNTQLDAKKYALSTARLSALQYQLNPHFLFNTLQSIDLEVLKISRQPAAANQMISRLSSLLRYALDDPMEPAAVREEITATKDYIELQSYRYKNFFLVTWEYSDEVLDVPVLRLLLQPIIENSILHADRSSPDRLWVKIKIRLNEKGLVFTILDNGAGIEKGRLKELQNALRENRADNSGRHIGLKNIGQRISLAYPDGYIKLSSKEGIGTIVEIGGIR